MADNEFEDEVTIPETIITRSGRSATKIVCDINILIL